jgi:hypothetical protein
VVTVGGAALLSTLTAPAGAAPAAQVPGDSVRIVAQFPAALVGGGFQITRDAGTRTHAASETLATGLLPDSGLVTVDVPRADLPADNGVAFVQVLAAVPVPGTGKALQSVASLGVTEQTLADTPVMTLVPPAPSLVRMYSFEEARALTGGGGQTGQTPPTAAEIAQMQAATEAQPVAMPEQAQPGTSQPTDLPEDAGADLRDTAADADGVSLEEALTGPANPSRRLQNGPDVPLSTDELRPNMVMADTVTDARDIYGVYTFRSWSTQGYAMWATFKMAATAETVTQNGYRAEAGAFSVNGTTSMSKEASTKNTTTDTWPKRSDCWRNNATGQFPAGAGDGPDCSNLFYGFIGAYGNDTWRWERHVSTTCSAGWVCFNTVYETLRNRYYIGGTFNDDFIGLQNYQQRPSSIRAGSFGNWTGVLPGSQRQSDFNVSFTKTRGATVGVQSSWGTAFGSATFESTTSQRNESLATMLYEFRYIDTGSGDGNSIYRSWYYDHDGGRRFDHFSCEFNPGWTGTCWTYGS